MLVTFPPAERVIIFSKCILMPHVVIEYTAVIVKEVFKICISLFCLDTSLVCEKRGV